MAAHTHCCRVVLEDLLQLRPVCFAPLSPAMLDITPCKNIIWLCFQLRHVITRPKPELLQCSLHAGCACSAKSRSDDLQRSALIPGVCHGL